MKKFKYTKFIKYKGINFNKLNYGTWAIQTTRYEVISMKHIIFIKQYLQRTIKKFKQFKFNIVLNKITTKKPLNSRMGGGKGDIYETQYFLKPGSIILEFYDLPSSIVFSIFKVIFNKISIKIKLFHIK